MGSDISRKSFDPKRQYQSVVMQQGRVTVDADFNEAEHIAGEILRHETRDVVGPVGTPDDGYRLMAAPAIYDFTIGAGTMYIGGLRVHRDTPTLYSAQSDWLDYADDPDWLPEAGMAKQNVWAGLILREQEVGAVEDTALREVALGGPDTAQRTRLVQHVACVSTAASDCPGGLASAIQGWKKEGLSADPGTMRLLSNARLQVSFPKTVTLPDPCEPQPVGGYLGADNQLIRVKVASVDSGGKATLVWGFDNASFLYRLKVQDSTHVKLKSAPPDVFRQPRAGQVVEILRAAVDLGTPDDYAAAPDGALFTLGQPYDPDSRLVTLPSALAAEDLDPKQTPALFLRVWEATATVTPGTPILLGQTGIQVTLTAAGGVFHPGDYWQIAVRPATTDMVYPRRLLDAPQPPDGPRLWFCPLGIMAWPSQGFQVISDCRKPFDNLVDLTARESGGCCTLTVTPAEVEKAGGLQAMLDKYANRDRVTLCLKPGQYRLAGPLRLGPMHSNLTLEACHDGAVIEADGKTLDAFIDGLIVLSHADNVTLRGLRFQLPLVSFREAGGSLAAGIRYDQMDAVAAQMAVSIGVQAVHCAQLTVEDCLFRFELVPNGDVFAAGLFLRSECWGLRVRRNRFLHEEAYLRNTPRPFRFLTGLLLVPALLTAARQGPNDTNRVRDIIKNPARAHALLDDGDIDGNRFAGLTVASLVYADLGHIDARDNQVVDCDGGFIFLATRAGQMAVDLPDITSLHAYRSQGALLTSLLYYAIDDPRLQQGIALATHYPWPSDTPASLRGEADTKAKAPAKQEVRLQSALDTMVTLWHADDAAANAAADKAQKKEATAREKVLAEKFNTRDNVFPTMLPGNAPEGMTAYTLTLTFSDNQVDTVVAGAAGLAALTVLNDERDLLSSVIVSGNRLRSFDQFGPSALVALVKNAAVTGNIVRNEGGGDGACSLAVVSLPDSGLLAIAVTGNVFHGVPRLPKRTNSPPAPLDDWNSFNTRT